MGDMPNQPTLKSLGKPLPRQMFLETKLAHDGTAVTAAEQASIWLPQETALGPCTGTVSTWPASPVQELSITQSDLLLR